MKGQHMQGALRTVFFFLHKKDYMRLSTQCESFSRSFALGVMQKFLVCFDNSQPYYKVVLMLRFLLFVALNSKTLFCGNVYILYRKFLLVVSKLYLTIGSYFLCYPLRCKFDVHFLKMLFLVNSLIMNSFLLLIK